MTREPTDSDEKRRRPSARSDDPDNLSGEIARAESLADLARAFGSVQEFAARSAVHCLGRFSDGGDDVFALGRLIADLRDKILIRVHDLVLAGTGPPPAAFCLLALGSEGRKEQYLATDQDNALVYDDEEGDEAAIFFEVFAHRFVRMLLELGVPPCPHGVMINAAQWRLSVAEWERAVDHMSDEIDGQGILKMSVLLDMRPVAGAPEPGWKLRRHLLRRIAERPLILRYLAREAVRFSPPLGLFNNFVVQKSGAHKGGLDVKKGGIFPLTQGIRTLAAEHGVLSTSTEERITGLLEAGALSAGFGARVREAYAFFHVLRTGNQAEMIEKRDKPDNFIMPDRLSAAERKRLKACFATVTEFQALVSKKYGLHLLT